jgi:hypothetical protein
VIREHHGIRIEGNTMKIEAAIVLFAAITLGCAKSKPQPTPPPPPIETPTPAAATTYPKQGPARAGDIAVRGCAVTSLKDNRADCICRRASTHLDAADPNKPMVMVCRTK